jgi:predicted DNA-binding ribbon-helix-helix protein
MDVSLEAPFFFKKNSAERRINLIIIQLIGRISEQPDGYQEEVITSLEGAKLGKGGVAE